MTTCHTYELDAEKQSAFLAVVAEGNYKKREVPYSLCSIVGEGFNATLYAKENHGKRKLCVQGAKSGDFVLFTLEPRVLGEAALGYEDVLKPEFSTPHAGSDESGKGDYFGPLVVSCVYLDAETVEKARKAGAKDCKLLSDATVLKTGEALRKLLGPENIETLVVSPAAYNRMYVKVRNLNRMLAKVHAIVLEKIARRKPQCRRAVVDQFAPTESVILSTLGPAAAKMEIVQRHKAEDDPAVAAASVVAREAFIREMKRIGTLDGIVYPLGSSNPAIAEIAADMFKKNGASWLMNRCKANFKTTDNALAACGLDRSVLPPEGRCVSTNSRP